MNSPSLYLRNRKVLKASTLAKSQIKLNEAKSSSINHKQPSTLINSDSSSSEIDLLLSPNKPDLSDESDFSFNKSFSEMSTSSGDEYDEPQCDSSKLLKQMNALSIEATEEEVRLSNLK